MSWVIEFWSGRTGGMLIVGLTGSIATGKSKVSKRIQTHSITVIDADEIAKEVVLKGTKGYEEIVDLFGKLSDDLLLENGELNRQVLGSLVFGESNRGRLRELNSITHPKVGTEILRRIASSYFLGKSMVVLDIPLLFEAKYHYFCGVVVDVACDPEIQLQRLLKRNVELSEQEARDRLASQMLQLEKRTLADIVIENNGTVEELEVLVDEVVERISPSRIWACIEWIPLIGIPLAVIIVLMNMLKYKKKAVRRDE